MSPAWLVIQTADSPYRDIEGRQYHFPTRIAHGQKIRAGDIVVVARPARDADGEGRVVGIGRIGRLDAANEGERAAVYDRYASFSPALGFDALGGDPRKNKSNAINPIPGKVVDVLLGRLGIDGIESLPLVEHEADSTVTSEKGATPSDLRDNLCEAVVRDLLGPAEGPNEEILTSNLRDRYLLGQLHPRGGTIEPAEYDEATSAADDGAEDGPAESDTPQARSLMPASIGLTFCVVGDAKAFEAEVSWGRYERVKSDRHLTDAGNAKTVWRRQTAGGKVTVALAERSLDDVADPSLPRVKLQGKIRKAADGDWLITLFLVNDQVELEEKEEEAWLFQPQLEVKGVGGGSIFSRRQSFSAVTAADDAERKLLEMQYRSHVEFAVGHGVSVHVDVATDDPTRATAIRTTFIPSYDLPTTESVTRHDRLGLAGLELDMKVLSELPTADLVTRLAVLGDEYQAWLGEQQQRIDAGNVAVHEASAAEALRRAGLALDRIREGVRAIERDPQAADAFRFANRSMWLQRVRSEFAMRRRRGEETTLEAIDQPQNRTWYPFQLGFLLITIPGIVDPTRDDRVHNTTAVADLLWFPTGGGKTEAYLGVAAFTMALRRLQGRMDRYDGSAGVAVIMRYTLRLLTIQQFQRASTLICAMEIIRRDALATGDPKWGVEPFRIGLWVGARATPNTTKDAEEAIRNLHGDTYHNRGTGTPYQLTTCPWCGREIKPGRDLKVDKDVGRTLMYCSDSLGTCEFSARQAPREGIPVVVVDEEIYHLLPTLLIGTVDKFAQMPWKGEVRNLFGRVSQRCLRHGFLTPDSECTGRHPKRHDLPRVEPTSVEPLRPPDLIIQDELHLISGPLGTMVGLYETAVDELCEWGYNGKTIRPKVIASTATIRRAKEQVHALFLRDVQVFPPRGLDIGDNFFAKQRAISNEHPGRRYLGVCAVGKSRPAVLIRAYVGLLTAAQQLYEEHGTAADPWMTLVGYFNSLRELGGMLRLVEDDVSTRTFRVNRDPDLPRPGLEDRQLRVTEELTSRKSSADIPKILDHLEAKFDPAADAERERAKTRNEPGPRRPIDVLLATNMVSVGVDVRRLGLMVVAGQPKNTAEYIQATSRVGRAFPGLVCSVFNWARPRDLSHYERFEHYHATFYQYVEALSVTPYATRALDRGLSALLVAMLRLQQEDLAPNDGAARLNRTAAYTDEVTQEIALRAWNVTQEADRRTAVENTLGQRLDGWAHEAQVPDRTLGYKAKRDGTTVALLQTPGPSPWGPFTILNSLRDVEPSANLIMRAVARSDEPQWSQRDASEDGQ